MRNWVDEAHLELFEAKGFVFANGEQVDVRLAYRTLGVRARDDRNVVLMLHGTTSSGLEYLAPEFADALFSQGQPLDVSRYFIILPDAIGHGESSRPSRDLGTRFPRYTYGDMVEAQHRVVREALGVDHLRLVLGASMGGMHSWMWGERYPEMMDALMPIASLPERVTGRNLLFRRLMIDLVRSDLSAAESSDLSGLGAAWNIFVMMAEGAAHLADALPDAAAADAHIRQVAQEARTSHHPVDVIWEFAASGDYDPAAALGTIRAPLLAVNFSDDTINPVELSGLDRAIRNVARGKGVTVPAGPGSHGHQTLKRPEAWREHLAQLLRETERPASRTTDRDSSPLV